MTRWISGQVPYASYHSKLILYIFDDRLRVIVTSANLTVASWQNISQVIWV
jgi:phosphatidylserine/phosphatidylglycerophosphate/cardiolipin synthase-like enzyme